LNGKRKIIVIIGVIIIIFSVAESTQAMGTNHLPPQVVVNINNQDVSRLLKPSIDLGIEPKIKIIMPSSVRIRTKSDLRNSQWLKEFLSTVRGGDNEKLIRSIISKKPEGRYLIEVSDTSAEIVGVSSRSNEKCMSKFKTLMNELYNL
jgi:hypothetical protein